MSTTQGGLKPSQEKSQFAPGGQAGMSLGVAPPRGKLRWLPY